MKNNYYYAVNGYNAVGIFSSWNRVAPKKKYIKGFRNKKFTTREEAEVYAKEVAAEILPDFCTPPSDMQVNYIYFIKEMRDDADED